VYLRLKVSRQHLFLNPYVSPIDDDHLWLPTTYAADIKLTHIHVAIHLLRGEGQGLDNRNPNILQHLSRPSSDEIRFRLDDDQFIV
jgi:hypothetical protein